MAYDSILKSLANREVILPILENQMRADAWPEKFTVEVDSSPYYGLNPDGTPDGYFHPSTHPLRTARQLYYEFHPDHRHLIEHEPYSMQRLMTVSVGSSLHAILQTQFQMTGLITDPADIEAEYINKEHHVRGRTDAVVHHPTLGPVIVEIKSRTGFKFDKTTIADMPSWEIQTSLACDNLSERYDTDFTYAILLMVETGWPFRMKELRVERNDALLREVYDKFDLVRAAIAANTPPPYCCALNSKEMKSCHARHACWLREAA
ncbi:exonuclease [Mycobacterium phage Phrappuccino]|uniref:Exonuclease n=1 Tax=Mycobacterium phage Phrappuccino TaxID=2591223 RepID=A0A514DDW3_9CAUD|nr:exonuclease [Mycobacterium phage Phrappuccino]QDH91800.1 exonuclease [Mycobacterium phage Phrappuccino]QIQ63242.1 Cas4 family exonuclease [Mycobacterium phage Settecandela]